MVFSYKGLIPANKASIHWDICEDNRNRISELTVCEWSNDINDHGKREFYKRYLLSGGCFYSDWIDKSEAYYLSKCWRIMISYYDNTEEIIKNCLFEFGKIKELENLRKIYYCEFGKDNYSYEEFMKEFYLVENEKKA